MAITSTPTKADLIKGAIRFAAVFATVFALELQRTSAKTIHEMEVAAITAIPLTIEKIFIGI